MIKIFTCWRQRSLFPFTKRGENVNLTIYIHAWWLTKHELTGQPKLDDSTRKLQVHLDNVKSPSVRAKPPPPLPTPPWNIAPVPRAQLGIYHSRLLTDPARNSSSPSRLGTAHPGGGIFTVAYDSWAYFHHGSGEGGGTQENPFPTNVQFSCWRLVERIERGYPFPANRPGPQLVLPRSVFLSSLNEPSVVDRSTRNLCEKSSLLSDRLDSKEWSVNYFGYEAALIIYRRFWQRFYTRLLRSLNK